MKVEVTLNYVYVYKDNYLLEERYRNCTVSWYINDIWMNRTYGVKAYTLIKLLKHLHPKQRVDDTGFYMIKDETKASKVLEHWRRLENKPTKQYYIDYAEDNITVKEFLNHLIFDILEG